MNIGIVTAVWNGYGKFVDQWLDAISKLETKPRQITIMLGTNAGIKHEEVVELLDKYPSINGVTKTVVEDPGLPALMGPMRNEAIRFTSTEWIMYLSVDDVILPGAINEFMKYEEEADYICIKWLSKATWNPRAKVLVHNPKTPEEMALQYNGKGFIVGHSPFRRSFWEKHPYKPHDFPNAPFVADMVEAGARFVKTEEPCTMYLRRMDSHAARLGRRKGHIDPIAKGWANKWKNNMQKRIRKYYRERQ